MLWTFWSTMLSISSSFADISESEPLPPAASPLVMSSTDGRSSSSSVSYDPSTSSTSSRSTRTTSPLPVMSTPSTLSFFERASGASLIMPVRKARLLSLTSIGSSSIWFATAAMRQAPASGFGFVRAETHRSTVDLSARLESSFVDLLAASPPSSPMSRAQKSGRTRGVTRWDGSLSKIRFGDVFVTRQYPAASSSSSWPGYHPENRYMSLKSSRVASFSSMSCAAWWMSPP
mmetsp:Transcript_30054/g.73160  ORF Transcript_30054/g.73160 Transcript_30054/m.73160 type:complete len:232 (+) Transcript_30054:1034-1729(+)